MKFELAFGSVRGREHDRSGRNNQDALAIVRSANGDSFAAALADGCGSTPHSEIGAHLGARLLARALLPDPDSPPPSPPDAPALRRLRDSLALRLRGLAEELGDDLSRTVHDHFLFTLLAVLVTPESYTVLHFGDGLVYLNGQRHELACAGNAPPYLGHLLMGSPSAPLPESPDFKILAQGDASDLQSLLLATDGATDIERAEARCLPGQAKLSGPISQFWTDDLLFRNPSALGRRLNLMARTVSRNTPGGVLSDPGLLSDDTTLLALRKTND